MTTQQKGTTTSLVSRGQWTADTQYSAYDAIFHNRALYTAVSPSRGIEPGSDASTWTLLAKAPPTTPKAEIDRVTSGLVSLGYHLYERDGLLLLLEQGEEIKRFDQWSITTDRRVLNREDLRPVMRPGSWTRVDTWMSQFPPIPKRPEELAAISNRIWEAPKPRG